jgi:predicted MFS family arabinose efflux permease
LGLMSLTYPVGTAAALVVASLIGTAHWRQPFIIYGFLGLLLGILVLLIVREPQRGANEEAVLDAEGVYSGRFSLTEFRQALRARSLLLGFGLDTCQASVNWSFAFWAPTYLTRYHIAPNAEAAALALLPAIIGFVLGALLGGIVIDRMRQRTRMAPVWVALTAMSGGLIAALLVFNIFQLAALMMAAFFLGLVTYMVMPAVTMIQFSVVPPETKATTISASNIVLNSVIAVLSLVIGVVSDAAGLRFAFGGAIFIMYVLGILVCLALLRTYRGDLSRRDELVAQRVVTG